MFSKMTTLCKTRAREIAPKGGGTNAKLPNVGERAQISTSPRAAPRKCFSNFCLSNTALFINYLCFYLKGIPYALMYR